MPNKFNCHRFKTGYLDESGENGKNGSKYLVLTYLCTKENKKISKILKKAKEQLRRTKKGYRWLHKRGGELKFYGFPDDSVLRKVLGELSKLDLNVKYIVIKKNGLNFNPSEKANILPELVVSSIKNNQDIPHKIVADRDYFDDKKIAYFLLRNYEEKIINGEEKSKIKKVAMKWDMHLIEKYDLKDFEDNDLVVSINHENSRQNLGLQAVDLICGAIACNFEKEDSDYLNLLKSNLKIEGKLIELKRSFEK